MRSTMVKSTESDWNRDGKLDYISIDLEIPLQDHEVIYGAQLYMLFDVKLYVRKSTFSQPFSFY